MLTRLGSGQGDLPCSCLSILLQYDGIGPSGNFRPCENPCRRAGLERHGCVARRDPLADGERARYIPTSHSVAIHGAVIGWWHREGGVNGFCAVPTRRCLEGNHFPVRFDLNGGEDTLQRLGQRG